jgi:hypothetical protein
MSTKLFAAFVTGTCLFVSAEAHAQATRTWVSGVGDDVNPCSRTAPCKTFAGAISKTAAGGEINILDPGGYGTVTITKSITIDGGNDFASILSASTTGITINVGASDVVTIRNVSINGTSKGTSPGLNGIRVIGGGTVHVENVVLAGLTQYGIDFAPGAAATLYVNNTTIQEAGSRAVYLHPGAGVSGRATLQDVRITNSGAGVYVADGTRATLRKVQVSGSANNGIEANSTGGIATINLDGVLVSGNDYGLVANGSNAVIRISDVGVYDNSVGMALFSGGAIFSYANNRNAGNGTPGAPTAKVTNAVPTGTTGTAFDN